jgi:YidC/Oxa1 family membrane protein insertase
MIPFANILQPLIDVFDAVLQFFHDSVGLSWGMSIIALTVAVRIVLFPLTLKQFRSMQALQTLAPEMKQLQAKYKDDKQRLNQEMMKFYQENKVNPFGSCLPLVAQLPVFISLFYMLRKDLRADICGQVAKPCSQVPPGHWGENFLFIPDITATATGGVLITLVVLYVGSQLLSSVLMSVTADRNQRMLMIALPFIFVPFIVNFPAGLLLYWITTNLWTVGQQTLIRKQAGMPVGIRSRPAPVPAAAAAGAPSRGAPATGGSDGRGGGRAPDRSTGPPPPPPRARKKKKTGRRR